MSTLMDVGGAVAFNLFRSASANRRFMFEIYGMVGVLSAMLIDLFDRGAFSFILI